ncbi:MAG: sulfotransferase family protein, partial [Planctomycetota bacterium]
MTPSTNPVSDKKFVIVLGPHRSGTSLATSLVERLGADLALPTREASEENLRGFFEHQEVVACNERLLEFLGGRWDNPLFRGKEALQACPEQELETWLTEAASILERDFQGVEFAAVKDPRMCQLLPFWTEALRRSGFRLEDLYFLHVGRHPAVVAASQSKRLSRNPDFYGLGKTPEEGAALWYSLTRDVLQGLPSDRNLLVLYDDLIGDSAAQLERIARFLDLEKQEQELLDICREAVDSGLNRSPLVEEDVAAIRAALPEALSLFDRLAGLATEDHFSARQGATILQEVEQARTETRMRRIAVPYLSRLALERLQQRARAQFSEEDCVEAHRQREAAESQKAAMVHEHAEEMRQQHDLAQQREAEMSEAHREEVHRLNLEATAVAERFRRTFSWRITAPLRGIRTLQNRAKVRLSTAWLRWRGRARERFLALRQRSP